MNTKTKTLVAAITAVVGLATSGQAAASVYAGSRLDIQSLAIVVVGDQQTPGTALQSYGFDLANTASLNGTADTNGGISASCGTFGTACSNAPPPTPVLAADAANAPGSAPLRVDGAANNWDFFGPGSGQTYANSDSEIRTAQIAQGIPTSTIQISEGEIETNGFGQSSTTVQSSTQLTWVFTVNDLPGGAVGNGTLIVNFKADPDLYVAVDTDDLIGAIAQANTGATFNLSSDVGVGVAWSPDGIKNDVFSSCSGAIGLTCTENNDDEDLNNTIGLPPNSNPIGVGISDPRSGNEPVVALGDFGFTITGLISGNYSLTLKADASMNLRQAVNVPEPTTIALLGLGLTGLGFARRRRNRKA